MGLGAAVEAVRDKLLLRLGIGSQRRAASVAARFHIDMADWYRSAEQSPHLPLVARAVIDACALNFVYDRCKRSRSWQIRPLGLVLKGGQWYLVGREGDGEPLTFRVAAMRAVSPGAPCPEQSATPDFDLPRWWARATSDFEARLRPHRAQLILRDDAAQRLAKAGHYAAQAVASGVTTAQGLRVALP